MVAEKAAKATSSATTADKFGKKCRDIVIQNQWACLYAHARVNCQELPLKKFLLSLVFFVSWAATAANADDVTFYGQCYFEGNSVSLEPGSYTAAELLKVGIPEDAIASIKVPSGYKVTVHADDNFQGRFGTLRSSANCLDDEGFSSIISSLSIESLLVDETVKPKLALTNDNSVTIYSECHYRGRSVSVGIGEYNAAQLLELGMPNNDISSVQVPAGLTIKLFENDFLLGRAGVLSSNDNCLSNDGFDDVVTSIAVVETPVDAITSSTSTSTQAQAGSDTFGASSESALAVFEHCNYRGGTRQLPVGRYTLNDLRKAQIGGDEISSIHVKKGYQVTVFDLDGFKGDSKMFTEHDDCLDNDYLNEKVSSLIVEPVAAVADGASKSLRELLPPDPTLNAQAANVDKALACVSQYVERNICDSARWPEIESRCGINRVKLFEDGFLKGHVEAGNCITKYWSSLSRLTANPDLR